MRTGCRPGRSAPTARRPPGARCRRSGALQVRASPWRESLPRFRRPRRQSGPTAPTARRPPGAGIAIEGIAPAIPPAAPTERAYGADDAASWRESLPRFRRPRQQSGPTAPISRRSAGACNMTHRLRSSVPAVVALAALAAVVARAQQLPTATDRTEVSLVLVDVTVLSRAGEPIPISAWRTSRCSSTGDLDPSRRTGWCRRARPPRRRLRRRPR